MTWNYRVIKRDIGGDIEYAIHEVYYYDDGGISAWSEGPISPQGDSLSELKWCLHGMMVAAVDKPILEEHNGKLREVRE